MSLGNPLASRLVENVVMNERLKGVVVVVAGVPLPLVTVENGKKISHSKVVSLAAKTKKMPKQK